MGQPPSGIIGVSEQGGSRSPTTPAWQPQKHIRREVSVLGVAGLCVKGLSGKRVCALQATTAFAQAESALCMLMQLVAFIRQQASRQFAHLWFPFLLVREDVVGCARLGLCEGVRV